VFLHDRISVTTERLTTSSTTTGIGCFDPAISANGEMLAFTCSYPDLVPNDTNGGADVFYRARTGTTLGRVVPSAGTQAADGARTPSLNRDGTILALLSGSNNWVSNDTNTVGDIFVVRIDTGKVIRVSVDSAGQQSNGGSDYPAFAADGSGIAFSSNASNLVSADNNNQPDIFFRSLGLFDDGFEN
jgi:Tol biopolymer transport system component